MKWPWFAVGLLLLGVVCATLPQPPPEWKDRIASNQRLWSKSVVSTARHHQPGMPLLIPSIGNGYVATVAGSDTVYVGGLFNGKNENGVELTAPSHRARVPAFLNLNVTGASVDYLPPSDSDNSPLMGGFAIDVREGVFYERTFLESEGGQVMKVEQHRYCHRRYESIIVHEIHLDNSLSSDSVDMVVNLEVESTPEHEDLTLTTQSNEDDSLTIYHGSIKQPELNSSLHVQVGIVVSSIPRTITVKAGDKRTVTFLFAIRTNIPGDKIQAGEEPYQAALRDFQAARTLQDSVDATGSRLLETHIEEWEKQVWSQGEIVIEGNNELAQIVYSSLYWIMMSTRADWPWNLSPGSLASNAYNGHSFWDTETWMYPPMLLLYPDVAESLLVYRFHHLEAAKAKARSYNHCGATDQKFYDCVIWPPDKDLWDSWNMGQKQKMADIVNHLLTNVINPQHMPTVPFKNRFNAWDENSTVPDDFQGNCGYRGAMFAWESSFTGVETCPCMAGGTCLYEHHISGDIAFAAYQYWQLTHDLEWLEEQGFPLAYEIAVFYESRGEWEAGQYVIKGVIPPDEAALGQDNSVYTNVIAMYSFRIAREFAAILGKETPSIWEDMAARMKIPFDTERQIHLEYDGYEPSAIKQADVILLGYPLQYAMSEEIRENDLNFYSDVTSRYGPAMTWSVTSIGYLELFSRRVARATCTHQMKEQRKELSDLVQKVSFYFYQSYQNAQPPYYIWTETPRGGAYNFITGAGGFLQALMAGFGGIRLKSDGYHVELPVLPPEVTSWQMNHLDYMGNAFDLSLNKTSVIVTLTHSNPEKPLTLELIDTCSHNSTVLQSELLHEGQVFVARSRSHLRLYYAEQEQPKDSEQEGHWFGRPVRMGSSWWDYLDSTTLLLSLGALIVIVLFDRTFYK